MIGRFALALAATASMLPMAAHAQEATTSTEEIVVTAQKREELLRDVPQSVTAIPEETLERLQANDFDDYAGHVPGLSVTGGQPGNSRVTLRGLNTGGVASTIGIYVDETPFGSSTSLVNAAGLALDLDPFDIQRIEVLRGPQGTLYGANTLGGLIKFVTAAPAPGEFLGRVSAGFETTEGGESSWTGRAMLNIPFGDRAALRVSGLRRSEGGYVDDPSRGLEDVNGVETNGWRAAFLLNATDNLTIRLSAQSQDIDSENSEDVAYFQSPLEPVLGDTDQVSPFDVTSDVTYNIFNGTIDWDLGWASLVSSTSYSELHQNHLEDGTLAFGIPSFLQENIPQDKTTQEVRLASNGEGPLEWLLGAFYTREHGLLDQEIFFNYPPAPIVTGLTATIDSEYEETAVFGGVTYHFTPQFDVNIGARYAENEQHMNQGGTAVSNGTQDSSDNAFTYSIAPRLRVSDQLMLYARVATGYRPGGPNILGVPSIIPLTFDPDKTINYEVGAKSDVIDGLLSVDLSVFRIDWTDIQLLVFDGAVAGNANGGGAESQGAEWSVNFTPLHGLAVAWTGAYTDTQLTDDTDPIVVGGFDGDPLPYAPKWASTLDVNYEWAVFGDSTAYVGGAWRYVGEQANGFPGIGGILFGAEQIELPSYNLLDLRAGVDFNRFSLEFYARNVTDERAVTQFGGFGQTLPNNPGSPNGSAVLVRPRTIGVALTANF
jgi:outer membrane receptor protein involved in Fe transport